MLLTCICLYYSPLFSMRNTRPALLFQKDNPNLCKNDVNAGQFPDKNHLDEPENSAEVPGYHTPQRNTALLGAGASRRMATASALSPRAAAAYPRLNRTCEPPNLLRARSPQGNAAAASSAPRMIRRGLPGLPPPPSSRDFSGGCARAERPPPLGAPWPPASTWCCRPGLATIRPVLRGWGRARRSLSPAGFCPSAAGAVPAPSRPPGAGAERRPGPCPAGTPGLLPVPGSGAKCPGRGHTRRQPPSSPPRPGRTVSSPGPLGSVPLSSPAQRRSSDDAFRPSVLFLMQEFLPSL